MFKPQHCGLYFTSEQVQTARKQRDREPFASAWQLLHDSEQDGDLPGAQWLGLRALFAEDDAAGWRALPLLLAALSAPIEQGYHEELAIALALGQGIELLRPVLMQDGQLDAARAAYSQRVTDLLTPPEDAVYVETLWLAALQVGAGVVLEREDLFTTGTSTYRAVIDHDIHPEGYIKQAVSVPNGRTYEWQVLSVAALVQTAEMATHAGDDLWAYDNRGVSVLTAAAYILFYYHFPEKWRWEAGLETEHVQALISQHGGFVEMLNLRHRPRTIEAMLDNHRPLYDVFGGGLTTLSHGWVQRRGLFG